MHQNDGTLKPGVVDGSSLQSSSVSNGALQDNSVTSSKLSTSGGTDGQVLTRNSGTSSGLAWTSATGSPDASSSSKGIVQLTGDLGGTATSPTVPGLAAKAVDAVVVHNNGAETIAGVKTFSSSPIVPATPTTANQAASKTYVDTAIGGVTPADATTISKGIVQLTGDLGGTAIAPTVPGLANKTNTTTTDALATRVTALESTGIVALTDATTIATDASSGKHFRVTVTADRTLGVPTNATDGMNRIWEITASTADRSLTLAMGTAGSFELTTGITSPITITNSKTLFLGAIFNSSRSRWTVIASRTTQ